MVWGLGYQLRKSDPCISRGLSNKKAPRESDLSGGVRLSDFCQHQSEDLMLNFRITYNKGKMGW